jgi:hypothetical protein
MATPRSGEIAARCKPTTEVYWAGEYLKILRRDAAILGQTLPPVIPSGCPRLLDLPVVWMGWSSWDGIHGKYLLFGTLQWGDKGFSNYG